MENALEIYLPIFSPILIPLPISLDGTTPPFAIAIDLEISLKEELSSALTAASTTEPNIFPREFARFLSGFCPSAISTPAPSIPPATPFIDFIFFKSSELFFRALRALLSPGLSAPYKPSILLLPPTSLPGSTLFGIYFFERLTF